MDPLFKKVKDIKSEVCVSIIFNTHRTNPDYQKDPIVLKNLIKEAEERLNKGYDKQTAKQLIDKIKKLADSIDHSQNSDSLVIFVNQEISDFTRLPIKTKDRVIINHTFATRDLIRAMHHESAYYVLVISRQQARLIEAYNNKVIKEITKEFPIDDYLYTTNEKKLTDKKGQDNLIEEFFNRVDKSLWETTESHPLPVIVATEKRNYDHFLKITDHKNKIVGHINKNRDDEKAHHIVPEAWEVMQKLIKDKNKERLNELHKAVSASKVLTDYNEIWKAIQAGRGKTLFVKRGHFQPALLANNEILLVDKFKKEHKEIVDDIIDEMIEQNLKFGGDVVFYETDELKDFNNLALIVRY